MDNPVAHLLDKATVVHLQPDDVLLIGNVGTISRETAEAIRDCITAVMPDRKLLIFESGIDIELLRNLEDPDE